MPEVEPCSMCDDREATTMWGLPVCQPCAAWLEYLDERLRALHPEPPERYIDRARRAIRQRRADESVLASDDSDGTT
jgi:hypothetical protein